MSRKIKKYIICDRCDLTEEIDSETYEAQFKNWKEGCITPGAVINKDLCPECCDDFRKWWIAKV